jgi:uncharacterized protein YndB with AHSA1/START domain
MTIPRNAVEPVPDQIVHVTAVIPGTPGRAFAYFTRAELLQTWLTAEAEVEPKPGGKYELFWDPANRESNSTIGCRVTALAPNHFLAFQWRSPERFKAFANMADPLTHVVVMFIPEGPGTHVHLIHSGWRSSSAWEEARMWQEQAWSRAFVELARVAAR